MTSVLAHIAAAEIVPLLSGALYHRGAGRPDRRQAPGDTLLRQRGVDPGYVRPPTSPPPSTLTDRRLLPDETITVLAPFDDLDDLGLERARQPRTVTAHVPPRRVLLAESAAADLRRRARRSHPTETGGILLGVRTDG